VLDGLSGLVAALGADAGTARAGGAG